MTTKDEVRSTVEALSVVDTLKLALSTALEALEETRNALAWFYDSYPQDVTQKGNDLLPHVETVLTAIRQALANKSKALADSALERIAENERELGLDYMDPAEIPQSIICPFCESQHVPGWLHDYNRDRMKKPAQQEPVATVTSESGNPNVVMSWWHEPALPVGTKLYTTPPQPIKPLTDEEIETLWHDTSPYYDHQDFVRAIEAAHGIYAPSELKENE